MASESAALAVGLAPPATPGGEPVTARAYRHPLLADPVIRLLGDTAAPGEDAVMAAAGFAAPAVTPAVAATRPTPPGYPAWALVHDPGNAAAALATVPDLERAAALAGPKAGLALELYEKLAAAVPPQHRPALREEAARALVAASRHKQAAVMFGKARADERAAGMAVDPVHRREIFCEFALAGALSVKDIKQYATELARGSSPMDAFAEFRELARRRTMGGLPPWPDLPKQLGALAKAAGLDPAAELGSLLESVVDSVALWRAADGFWTTATRQLRVAVAASPLLRARMLWQLPEIAGTAIEEWWLELLDHTAAFDDLSADTADWLTAVAAGYRGNGPRACRRAPQALLDLISTLAPRAVAAGVKVGFDAVPGGRVDAAPISRCLAAGIPVSDPRPHLMLADWGREHRTDVEALVADSGWRAAVERSIIADTRSSGRFAPLWSIAPLEPVLAGIVETRLDRATAGGLEQAISAVRELRDCLDHQALEHLPHLEQRLAEVDMVAPLTRTLRAGILDELGWDALDEAATQLGQDRIDQQPSWPVLTLNDRHKAIAIAPGGRLTQHPLSVPHGASRFDYTVKAFYTGGQLLVCHYVNGRQTHYWTHEPGVFAAPPRMWEDLYYQPTQPGYTFLAPNGHRFMKDNLLAPGDHWVGRDGHMFFDGRDYWWDNDTETSQVRRFDLAAGELDDEPGLPEFLDPDTLPEGHRWVIGNCSLAQLPDGVTDSPLGSKDGMVGFRLSLDRHGNGRYTRIDGTTGAVTLAHDSDRPWGLIDFPGTTSPLLLTGQYEVTAHDPHTGLVHWRIDMMNRNWVSQEPREMAKGTRRIPPPAFWHFLTPRDEAGSAALRAIGETTVAGLLTAAATSAAKLSEAVEPLATHPLLREGIAGVVTAAADARTTAAALTRRLRKTTVQRLKVTETDLTAALDGLVSRYSDGHNGTARQIELAAAFLAGTITGDAAMEHWQYKRSPHDWTELAGRIGGLAVRAASAATPSGHRYALRRLLAFWAGSALAQPGLRRGLLNEEFPRAVVTDTGRLLPLDIAMSYSQWGEALDGDTFGTKAYLQIGQTPPPPGHLDRRSVPTDHISTAWLRQLVSELEAREPVGIDPDAVRQLATRADMHPAAAALLVAGLPGAETDDHNYLPSHIRGQLNLKVTEAVTGREHWRRIPPTTRLAVYHAALPEDPAQLWEPATMAIRLADAYRAAASPRT